jgi:hypothetical protein
MFFHSGRTVSSNTLFVLLYFKMPSKMLSKVLKSLCSFAAEVGVAAG